jgi:uncharacterized protein (DUF305 family)
MPEQCRAMMQNMPQGCMGMMQRMGGAMQQGGSMSHGMHHGPQGGAAMQGSTAGQSEATRAYMAALDEMHGPMAEGVKDPDPDVAFMKGMIPHHQGAIEMAKIVLRHGTNEQTKRLARDVIREQEREIAEMQAWLQQHRR